MSAHGSVVDRAPCPECGSTDNVAVYEDGYEKCYGMSCEYYKMPDGEDRPVSPKQEKRMAGMVLDYEVRELPKRQLREKTLKKWKYAVGKYNGQTVQIANYSRDGQVVAQKLRFPNKDFLMLGDTKHPGLYGQHLWRDGGKYLCITEGEIDALSVSQLFDDKWPVVSLPNGAQSAVRSIKAEYEWIMKFDNIVLMFDNDEAGKEATEAVCHMLPPGKVKVAQLPLKDANEMLKAGRGGEVIEAFWNAKVYRPDGILSMGDLMEEALKPIEAGLPWPWQELTDVTYGRRDGEVYAIGAGTGVGKTDYFTQCIIHDAENLNVRCGVLYLEQPPVETVRRLAGKLAGRRFHLPDAGWTEAEYHDALKKLEEHDNIYLYNHFGIADWETIRARIRYMVVSLDCKHIYLDHLTALAAGVDDERKALEEIMADLAGDAQEMGHKLHFVSHLATPEGKPHEEGGRVMIRHFKGSRAIGYWSHFMFGIERDQQAEERDVSTFRVLKDRYSGQATGFKMGLRYDHETGLLSSCPTPEAKKKTAKDYGFNESQTGGDF
jgi:twinkle protein